MAPQREWFDKDYYAELGVSPDATEKEITRAYRKLAKQFHPDANAGDKDAEDRFKEVSAAHDVLGDAEKRKEYDQVREMVASGVGPGGPGGFGAGGPGGFGNVRVEDLGDLGDLGGLFGNLFGGRGGRRGRNAGPVGPQRGNDIETELHLDFLDAVHGITTSVNITSEAPCHVCNGTGAKPGTFPERCPTCNGAGSVAVDQGPFSFSEVCPTCGGRGSVIKDKCKNCKGRGVEVRPRTVKVRIPAGVDDGQRIRVKGRGTPGFNGGPPGDLYVVVHVAPHPIFARSGKWDLTVKVPITFPEAVLGAQVKVPTLEAPVTVKVPPGTQTGKTVRVRGRGIPRTSGDPGALLVTFDVVVPHELDDGARAAVEALATTLPGNPREHLGVQVMDDDQRALYIISVAAELAGVHPQTLRIYERKGLIEPSRTEGRSRRYSDRDIALLQRIQELTNDGVSLAGVRRILELEAEVEALGDRLAALEDALIRARDEAQSAVRAVHRSYRRDLVPVSRAVVKVPRR